MVRTSVSHGHDSDWEKCYSEYCLFAHLGFNNTLLYCVWLYLPQNDLKQNFDYKLDLLGKECPVLHNWLKGEYRLSVHLGQACLLMNNGQTW